jgi:hypothetical protein
MKKNRFFQIITNPLIISFSLLTILIIISSNGKMGSDEGIWSYIGRLWSQNRIPPYVGAIENKTPGIFELYAISNVLFGVNIFFVRGLGVLSILISSLIVFYIGRKLHSLFAGVFGMYIFGLTMTWDLLDGEYITQTETFMVLFSTLSFYFVIKGEGSRKWKYWVLLAGISMGLAIAFKQIALTTSLALLYFNFVYILRNMTKQNKYLGFILLGLGISISTLVSLIPLLLSNVFFKDYIEGAWLILLNSGSSASLQSRIKGFLDVWLNSRIVVFYPFLLLLLFQNNLVKNRFIVGLLIWLLFDFIGVNSSGYYFGHQIKQLIPSLSLITGLSLSNLLINLNSKKSVDTKSISILIIAIFFIFLPYKLLLENGNKIINSYSNNPSKEIGTWLRDNTNKTDYVYIIGDNSILSYSERVSSSKYFSLTFIESNSEIDVLLSDLKAKPPKYILKRQLHNKIIEKIEEFILKNYTFLQSKYDYDVFIQK